MSGNASMYWALAGLNNGARFGVGTFDAAAGEVSIGGIGAMAERLTIPADDYLVIYDYTRDGIFTSFGFSVVGEGNVEVGIYTDIPTSTTNLAASNTGPRWQWLRKSNFMPFLLDSPTMRTSTTANLGDWTGTSGGDPALIVGGTDVEGRVYKVCAWNRDEETDVLIERFQTK